MVPSIKERKENSRIFGICYENICKMQRRMPVPFVKTHLKKGALDFSADRITYEEWGPILNALSMDASLHFIGIRSMQDNKKALEYITTESQAKVLERIPVIQSRYLLMLLVNAVKCCMSVTRALTCIELEGLPLGLEYLKHILEGIPKCKTLQTISFYRSPIGDEGCEALCHVIKSEVNIFALDLSDCNITERGVLAIVELIKFQKLHRCSETWKQTLRYRIPNLESLPGIRRIILNDNQEVGDRGLLHLVNILKDDLFIKALDVQNCSITDIGGCGVLDMLRSNTTIAIVDVRANVQLSPDILSKVMKQLALNNEGVTAEYQWIDVKKFTLPRESRPLSQQSASRSRSNSCRRTVSGDSITAPIPLSSQRSKSIVLDKGVPWRISVRLNQRQENAMLSPGTPRSIQLQEEKPPYRVIPTSAATETKTQLLKMRNHIAWLEEQLELEVKKREEMEKEKDILKNKLDECRSELNAEKNAKQGKVLIDLDTMQSLEKMLNEVADVIESPTDKHSLPSRLADLTNNEKKSHISSKENMLHLTRKSQSEHVKKEESVKLEKLSTSACMLRELPRDKQAGTEFTLIEGNVGDTIRNCENNKPHDECTVKYKGLDKQLHELNTDDRSEKEEEGIPRQDSEGYLIQGYKDTFSNRTVGDKVDQNEIAVSDTNSLYHIVVMKNKQLNQEDGVHLNSGVSKSLKLNQINATKNDKHSKPHKWKRNSRCYDQSKRMNRFDVQERNISPELSSDAEPDSHSMTPSTASTGERNIFYSQDSWSTLTHMSSSEKSYETESDDL